MSSPASVEGRERLRLFCALCLPDAAGELLAEWQQTYLAPARDVRLVAPADLHVTLAFLGSVAVAEVASVGDALRDAAQGADRPTVTPRRYRETRSVGMVVFDDEDGRATALALTLQGGLEQLGLYRREARPWLPHVTVIRFRRPPRLSPPLPELGAVALSDAALYHSVLRSTGAQYEILESVALGG